MTNGSEMDHVGMAYSIINGRRLTDELLEEVLAMLATIDAKLGTEGLKKVRDKLESTIGIQMAAGDVMRESVHAPWVSDAKGTINWNYWDSYKQMLSSQGWSPTVVKVLDEDTDNILTECGNPAWEGAWELRGLVMGDVQSGKTASYSGLIAKAADAGYKVIVLLTGMIEELRRQSQERLDLGFVGRDSRDKFGSNRTERAIGAGIYRSRSANVLTSVDFDFLTNNARVLDGIPLANISEPILFVMKKNSSPLENLIGWLDLQLKLSSQGNLKHSLPLLIIDDEADNASVNVRKAGQEPATINRLIRKVIGKFSRSSYVAYTATPFANVFIDPDNEKDLFPSNFIYSLNTPSHYIGANSIFQDDGEYHGQLKSINDAEKIFPHSHKKNHTVIELPQSLLQSVQVFLITCAIRDLRAEELRHRSMLVNVSRFTDVQARISGLLNIYLWSLQEEIKQHLLGMSWRTHPLLIELENTFHSEFPALDISWDEIRKKMYDAVASVKVVTINQKSSPDEKLDYTKFKSTEKGRRVIAVGGLTLSRGLTLEGLCVSYFYRNSKAYDTLLQMGRWFGYRPGYEDLFRIWMEPNAQNWYAHIAGAVAELRMDFKRMSANGLKPSSFGIRVKSHPDMLIVTAQNKMRTAREIEQSVSFSAFGVETAFVPKPKTLNEQNVKRVAAFGRFLGASNIPKENSNRYIWNNVPKSEIAAFISELNIGEMNTQFLPDKDGNRPFIQFIENNNYEQLNSWDVCIPQGRGDPVAELEIVRNDGSPGKVKCRARQFERTGSSLYLKLNRQRVGDVSDEMVGMDDQLKAVTLAWIDAGNSDPKKIGKATPGYFYRRFRQRPLLTIHMIQCIEPTADPQKNMLTVAEVGADPIVAISISFPDFDPDMKGEKVVYRLNKIAINELFGNDDDAGEDENDTD